MQLILQPKIISFIKKVERPYIQYYCGYVGVDKNSPLYGKSLDEIEQIAPQIKVFGGITYVGEITNIDKSKDPKYWVIGWDTNHYSTEYDIWYEKTVLEENKKFEKQISTYIKIL